MADATAAALAATTATIVASVAAIAAELSTLTYRDYLRDNNNYLLYHNTSKCLVKQIVKAVPMIYIEELENPITKFGKLTPYALLKHLLDTYGAVSDSDLDANQVRMKAKWMPPMPIEALFRQLRKAQDFAEQAGEEIPDTALCRAGYNNLQSTGLFTQSCYEWRMIQSPTNKTWDKFKAHFTLAAKDRKNSSRNTQDAGYHETANNTVDDNATVGTTGSTRSDIFALTEAILTQTAANATNFATCYLSCNIIRLISYRVGLLLDLILHRLSQSIIVGRMDAPLIRIIPVPNVKIQPKAMFLLLHGVINWEAPIEISLPVLLPKNENGRLSIQ